MKWWPGECSAGDMIRIKIGAIYHYGIFVSEDEIIEFGEPPIGNLLTRPSSEVKVCRATADEFSCGNIIEVAKLDRREKRERIKPKKTVEIARSRIGEGGYNLIHNNCEHFVYECVFGVKKSTQEDEAREKWRNRPICAVYIANVTDGMTVGEVANRQRDAEIAHARNESVKAEKYLAWKTLEFAASDTLGLNLDECSPKKHANGRWTADGMFFSISHSCGTVAVAVSNAEIGVDIENTAKISEKYPPERLAKLSKRIGAGENGDVTGFLRTWTRKESIYKRLGKGAFDPKKIGTDEPDTRSGILETEPELFLSLSGKHSTAMQIYKLDGTEKTQINSHFKEITA